MSPMYGTVNSRRCPICGRHENIEMWKSVNSFTDCPKCGGPMRNYKLIRIPCVEKNRRI